MRPIFPVLLAVAHAIDIFSRTCPVRHTVLPSAPAVTRRKGGQGRVCIKAVLALRADGTIVLVLGIIDVWPCRECQAARFVLEEKVNACRWLIGTKKS